VAQVNQEIRDALLDTLLTQAESDTYPSSTILDMIESMLTPQALPRYATLLLDNVRASNYPSLDLIKRAQALT
jgi:hypothetical protein